MANHCYNFIELSGEPDTLNMLCEKIIEEERKEYKYLVDKLDSILMKKQRKDSQKHYMYYGSRWFDITVSYDGDRNLLVQGDSAWSPLITFIEELCIQYSLQATYDYEEPGCDIAGVYEFNEEGYVEHTDMTYQEYRYKTDVGSWMDEQIDYYRDLIDWEDSDEKEIKEEINKIEYASDKVKEELIEELLNKK